MAIFVFVLMTHESYQEEDEVIFATVSLKIIILSLYWRNMRATKKKRKLSPERCLYTFLPSEDWPTAWQWHQLSRIFLSEIIYKILKKTDPPLSKAWISKYLNILISKRYVRIPSCWFNSFRHIYFIELFFWVTWTRTEKSFRPFSTQSDFHLRKKRVKCRNRQ